MGNSLRSGVKATYGLRKPVLSDKNNSKLEDSAGYCTIHKTSYPQFFRFSCPCTFRRLLPFLTVFAACSAAAPRSFRLSPCSSSPQFTFSPRRLCRCLSYFFRISIYIQSHPSPILFVIADDLLKVYSVSPQKKKFPRECRFRWTFFSFYLDWDWMSSSQIVVKTMLTSGKFLSELEWTRKWRNFG